MRLVLCTCKREARASEVSACVLGGIWHMSHTACVLLGDKRKDVCLPAWHCQLQPHSMVLQQRSLQRTCKQCSKADKLACFLQQTLWAGVIHRLGICLASG